MSYKYTCLNKLLKKLDHFSVTIQFRINNYKKYSSATGGIIFFIYLLFSIFFTIAKFRDYISWQESRLQFIDKSPVESPVLNLTDLKFEYAVAIVFDNETSIFQSYLKDLFTIEHRFLIIDNSNKITNSTKIINYPRFCNDTDFKENYDNSIPIEKLKSNFRCFDIEKNYILQGIYTDKLFTYIELMLNINRTYFDNYQYLEEIFKMYQFKFTIYFTDNFIDVSNIKSPHK